ncbi:MAG: pectinacetylesterase family protein [Desulfobacterales bacterium]|nr:pectinacetylesterase family protein [Desulfobacterales bacterium]
MRQGTLLLLAAALCLPFLLGGCEDDIKYYQWNTVQLESSDGGDYVCGNGSAYKFFVNPSLTSKNWLIYYEGGGACWDYPSCSGQEGIKGAANPNGIPDDYMKGFSIPAIMSPFIFRAHPWERVATQSWNIIFVPYCTGDIFIGDNAKTYVDPDDPSKTLTWHHNGFKNTMGILDWMKNGPFKKRFKNIPKLMVTGCSAGGAGSILNYHFIRKELGDRVKESILFNDSGPIYYTLDEGGEEIGFSGPLHNKIKEAWNVENVINQIGDDIEDFDENNFGTLSDALSIMYPQDKIAHTQFTMDRNYSGYSYERFYDPPPTKEEIHAMWAVDQGHLLQAYENLYALNGNMGYFVPYYRPFNESHCTCVLSFDDTDITGTSLDVGKYANMLIDSDNTMDEMRFYEEPSQEELDRPYPLWNLLKLLMDAL